MVLMCLLRVQVSLPALLNVGTLLSLLLFVYAVLGVSLFHSACTVPPPSVIDHDGQNVLTSDPCSDPDKLDFSDAFVARNHTEATLAWIAQENHGQQPSLGWDSLCVERVLQCGDFHKVWQCEDPTWGSQGNSPRCAGDGDEQGRPYHECICENIDVHANFASFGRVRSPHIECFR